MSFIPESDVYRLSFGSKLPNAERLTDWIVEEVIPAIRKHGAYMTPEVIERTLTDPDYIIQLATTLKEERQKRKALESENERQKQVIADFEPIRQYVDTILESAATLTITQIAADSSLPAQTVRRTPKCLHSGRRKAVCSCTISSPPEGLQPSWTVPWPVDPYTKNFTHSYTHSGGNIHAYH